MFSFAKEVVCRHLFSSENNKNSKIALHCTTGWVFDQQLREDYLNEAKEKILSIKELEYQMWDRTRRS